MAFGLRDPKTVGEPPGGGLSRLRFWFRDGHAHRVGKTRKEKMSGEGGEEVDTLSKSRHYLMSFSPVLETSCHTSNPPDLGGASSVSRG